MFVSAGNVRASVLNHTRNMTRILKKLKTMNVSGRNAHEYIMAVNPKFEGNL